MSRYAVLNNNYVSNIIVCDSQEIAEEATGFPCVELTEESNAYFGWMFNPSTRTFFNPNSLEVTDEPSA